MTSTPTCQQQSSGSLSTSIEFLSRLVSRLPDALIATDAARRILLFNQAAQRLFGIDESAAIGSPLEAWLRPDPAAELSWIPLSAVLESSLGHALQRGIGVRPDGQQFPVEMLSSPLSGATSAETVYLVRGIADRLRAEFELREYTQLIEEARAHHDEQAVLLEIQGRELAEAQKRADEANRAKSQFLANMSHEIRSPMTSILGFAELLRDLSDCPELIDAAETIQRNGNYLLELINDILDLSKIEAGKISLEHLSGPLRPIIDDVARLMRVRADAQSISFVVDYADDLPEAIETDPTRVRQILINLLSNAFKFTRQGTVRLRVSRDMDHDAMLNIEVADSGIGMTAEQLDKVFQPFTQADASINREFGGTGLGLAISRRLAEALGGALEATSQFGKGSVFTLRLPIGIVTTVDPNGAPQSSIEHSRRSSADDKRIQLSGRILLAEDSPDNQRLIAFLLRKAGAEVEVVGDGAAAVDRARGEHDADEPFDVVLMDVQMPNMDGIEATRTLRELGYNRPILALTAHAMRGDRERCLAAGFDDYASKPINRGELLRIVSRHLSATSAAPTL